MAGNKSKLFFAIYSDPETSGLAAEALRMAMGLSTGNRTVEVALLGPAVKVLGEDVDDLVDGEMIEKHLAVFEDWETPFYTDADAPDAPFPVSVIGPDDLARRMAGADQVMVFQ